MMKRKTVFRYLVVAIMALSLVWLTACQAIGGLDINKALQSTLERSTYEGNASFVIEFDVNDQHLDSDGAQIYQLLNPLTISLDEIKVKDVTQTYVKGSFSYSLGHIPFQLVMNESQLTIKLDGLDKPIQLSAHSVLGASGADAMNTGIAGLGGMSGLLEGAPLEVVIQQLAGYVITKLPNPDSIQITPIHDETDFRYKLNIAVKGDEFSQLLTELLANISKDEAGVKALLGGLYDVIIPGINAQIADGSLKLSPIVQGILKNKDQTVHFLYGFIEEALNGVSEDPDNAIAQWSKQLSLDLALYFDEQLQLRKSNFVLDVDTSTQADSRFNAIKISGSSEAWNINGNVTIPAISTRDALVLNDQGFASLIAHVEKGSDLYALLKAAGMNKVNVVMQLKGDPDSDTEVAPYIDAKLKRTYVPVRQASEQLDAEVKWDNTAKRATVVDAAKGITITMELGSEVAMVNGIETALDAGPQLKNSHVYVPIAFLANALDIQYTFDNETKVLTLIREY